MNRYMFGRNSGCGNCNCGSITKSSRSEVIAGLKEYKNDLEAEIAALEHRLQSYKNQDQS